MCPVLLLVSYTYGQKNYSHKTLAKLALTFLSPLLIACLPTILQGLIQSSDVHLSARLEELYGFLTERNTSGRDMQARFSLYEKSLHAFFASPLWGAFGGKVYGSHSTLLDLLGAYGVLGLVGYFGLFRPFKLAKRRFVYDRSAFSVMRTTMYAAVFLSVVNVLIGSEIMLTLLVIIPLAMRYLTDRKEEKLETGPNQSDP